MEMENGDLVSSEIGKDTRKWRWEKETAVMVRRGFVSRYLTMDRHDDLRISDSEESRLRQKQVG